MIVRSLEDIIGTDRDIAAETWSSRRLLLASDGTAFSLHDTIVHAGTETSMWYRHHVEAVYCIEGEGEIDDVEEARTYVVKPGTMYVLDKHDTHVLRAKTRLRLVCVFAPPLEGHEAHDECGGYPPADSTSLG